MYSLSRNSCAKAFGNWSRRSDLRPKKSKQEGGPNDSPVLKGSRVKRDYPRNKSIRSIWRIYPLASSSLDNASPSYSHPTERVSEPVNTTSNL